MFDPSFIGKKLLEHANDELAKGSKASVHVVGSDVAISFVEAEISGGVAHLTTNGRATHVVALHTVTHVTISQPADYSGI